MDPSAVCPYHVNTPCI